MSQDTYVLFQTITTEHITKGDNNRTCAAKAFNDPNRNNIGDATVLDVLTIDAVTLVTLLTTQYWI